MKLTFNLNRIILFCKFQPELEFSTSFLNFCLHTCFGNGFVHEKSFLFHFHATQLDWSNVRLATFFQLREKSFLKFGREKNQLKIKTSLLSQSTIEILKLWLISKNARYSDTKIQRNFVALTSLIKSGRMMKKMCTRSNTSKILFTFGYLRILNFM